MAITCLGTMREELQGTSVDALFQRGEAERLLARPRAQEDLEKITKSERGDHRLRVLAHELLLMTGKTPDPKMVRIYCEAIDGAFMHNWWALPGHHLGKLGTTIVRFGEPALQFLVKDLDNPTVLTCLGPDARLNREHHYTVADLAAYLVCEILERPFADAKDADGRLGPRLKLRSELNERLASDRRK